MPDWMAERTLVTTVADLMSALIGKPADMKLLGFYDDGFGIARNVSVGIEVSQNGERFFAIDVEDERPS